MVRIKISQVLTFLGLHLIKFGKFSFLAGFTEKPLSCVERGVSRALESSIYNRLLEYKMKHGL